MTYPAIIITFLFFAILLPYIFRVLNEFERGVVYTLGRLGATKGPGVVVVIPILQRMLRVDMRVQTLSIPNQDIISKDNVSVKVNAVVYYRVIDANKAVNQVRDCDIATSEISQTTLRAVLGKHDLDSMLSEREQLNADIRKILDEKTEYWGIKVESVEIKNIDISSDMIKAIGKQAEAERERRAKVISAEGEYQAASKIAEAAHQMSGEDNALALRYISAMQDISNGKTNTIILPIPMDLFKKIG